MSTHLDRIRPLLTANTFLGRLPGVVLDTLMRRGQLKTFAKGEVVYRRGEPGDSLMVVISGGVKLTNTSVGAKEVVLHFLRVGDICGEIAALDGKARAATAVALESTEVLIIYTSDLLPTLLAHPQAMLEIIHALCEKVRGGAAIIEDGTLEMRGRAARGLLRLARQHGLKSKDGLSIQLTVSQEDLGKYLGLSRANVSRQLSLLRAEHVIKVAGAQISITDEAGLAEIADTPEAKD